MAGISIGVLILIVGVGLITLGAYYVLGMVGTLFAAFLIVCALMIITILIQRPKGGGLSGAFGGAGGGSSQAVFGSKVGDVLTWATVGFFVAFLGLAMGLTYAIRAEVSEDRAMPLFAPSEQPASQDLLDLSQTPMPADDQTIESIEVQVDEPAATPVPMPASGPEPDSQ